MKKTLLLSLTLFAVMVAFGQNKMDGDLLKNSVAPIKNSPTPGGQWDEQQPPSVPPADFRGMEEEIGTTTFETQCVTSMGRRVGDFGDGRVSALWHFGSDNSAAPSWPDRGSGYNSFDGDSWGPQPDESLEVERSGYPSFTVTPNGMEAIVSHKSVGDGWVLSVHTKEFSDDTWTEHEIPSDVFNGNVWGKIASGGPDGNTLHVLAISLSPAFGGGIHVGMDAHPLYFRSTDGGETWDVKDFIIPGIDSTVYNLMNSESYTIEAEGETVAIAVYPFFGDVAIAKSTDNGDTWEKTIVNDFPFDNYDEMGYDSTQVPQDPDRPDPLAILSTDGNGTLVIDADGKVHTFFGQMYWWDGGMGDFFLDLGTTGIAYWNEDMATDEYVTIIDGEDLDFDDSGTLDIDGGILGDIRYGNGGLASYPTAARDADGNLYVVYQAMREDFLDAVDQNYRHIFIIKSEDGGETWSEPFDIINENVTEIPEFIEAAYPALPPVIGESIHLTYLQDFVPGQTATGAMVPEQLVMHVQLDKNSFDIFSDAEEVSAVDASLSISPNPASGLVQVQYVLLEAAETQVQVLNLLGERVLSESQKSQLAGQHVQSLEVSTLSSGVYFVQLKIGEEQVVRKLVVR